MQHHKFFLFTLTIGIILFFISCEFDPNQMADSEESSIGFDVPPGFALEDLYTPSASGHGSWVSIAEGPGQTMYACDQYGGLYRFKIPAVGAVIDSLQVDSVELNIGYAQGLLYAFNSLYVVVSRAYDEDDQDKPTSGIYRLQDQNQDGELDKATKILALEADGEHGPHTLRVSPDGESLYFIAGNFNPVPDHFTSRLPQNWQEDQLLPVYLDARGHANDLTAPGAWIAKSDPLGEHWEIIGAGMRNPFSFGFNADGELFAYDADMEWDFGMPWYRPTRILHVTSGAEFGWRTGSGKWPVFYPDNLPSVTDLAQGSPTAVIMAKDLQFPAEYQTGLFACDWSFGTIYYVDLQPEGSSYRATRSEFLSGTPLPISNAIAGSDGHLYFITGGRRLESHLYRLRPTEEVSRRMQPASDEAAAELRLIRKSLEAYHTSAADPAVITAVWPYLAHEDQFIRYAARIALEHQPLSSWQRRFLQESDPTTLLQAALAYARSDGALTDRVLTKLSSLDYASLDLQQQILLLRDLELLLIRNKNLPTSITNKIKADLTDHFPTESYQTNRLLSQILIYLEDDAVVTKCIALLEQESSVDRSAADDFLSAEALERSEQYGPQIKDMLENMPPVEALHYATVLSHATAGWDDSSRERYFDWFYEALSKKGGESYKAFLDNIRATALSHVPEAQQDYYQKKSGYYSPLKALADIPEAAGPGKHYTLMDLGELFLWNNSLKDDYHGNIQDGRRAYQAAFCESCHRMRGEGGASGPDLTQIATRFEKGDIANAILSPNEEISDQYAFSILSLKDQKVVGRLLKESDDEYQIYQSPYAPNQITTINKSDVIDLKPSPISPMPAQLLNRLNEQEVRDLFVYLLAGGDPESDYYQEIEGEI